MTANSSPRIPNRDKGQGRPDPSPKVARHLPGDPHPQSGLERILRVDHAGEYGARRIYEGQLAILKYTPNAPTIKKMWEQELKHLEYFEKELPARRVRPTALQPVWHVAGFALGALSAAMGEKAAMACTVAVEEVIDTHYARQIEKLEDMPEESALRDKLETFRAEELEHRDTGLQHGARETLGYTPLTTAVKAASKVAIWLSERV